FTLYARCRKGRRPNFMDAAGAELGEELYNKVIQGLGSSGLEILTGEFGADMNLFFNNNGPVTIILDSRED
ncbi:MAG: D-aminoacyl-tRNA deacylase, partial [Ezakiella massiliensis]